MKRARAGARSLIAAILVIWSIARQGLRIYGVLMPEGGSADWHRNQRCDAIRIRHDGKNVRDTGRASGLSLIKIKAAGLNIDILYM
jgi:hypothetical protein